MFPACGQTRQRRPSTQHRMCQNNSQLGGGITRSVLENSEENSKGIVQLRLLWISTKTRPSVFSRKVNVNKLGLTVKESP